MKLYKKLIYALLAILVLVSLVLGLYLGYTLFLYTRPNPWLKDTTIKSDEEVQMAMKNCRQGSEDKYDCYVQYAIEYENPNICALTSIFVDDACLDDVWRAIDDPSICDRIYLVNTRPNCRNYFSNHPPNENP
jgi:hypothetical protein